MTQTPTYAPPYEVEGNCLYMTSKDKQGLTRKRLCNFVPFVLCEVCKDDGAELPPG